jgi:uncharacterized membrane protein
MTETDLKVPNELKQHKQSKDAAEEKAGDDLKSEVSRGECFLSALGYVSFLCVLPLVLMKDSEYAQHHGKQALVLAILIYFLDAFHILPPKFQAIYVLFKYGVILVSIMLAFSGKMFRLPGIFGVSEKFNITVKSEK